MSSTWFALLAALVDHLDADDGLAGTPIVLGPVPDVPSETTVVVTRGRIDGDRTRLQHEIRMVVHVECWEVSGDDYRTRTERLANLEADLVAAIREWRQAQSPVPRVRHKAEIGQTDPDGGAFLPHALASRTELTLSWMEMPR